MPPMTRWKPALIAVEQFVFWTAFVIRKMADSYKLSDEFESSEWKVESIPKRASAPPVDLLNLHRIDRRYDFTARSPARLKLRQLCGLLVHSFIFMPETDENGRALTGLLFNSDRTKETAIYRISWDGFCQIISELHGDDIVEISINRLTGAVIKHGPGPGQVRDDL
jgi:hypothetical protein